MLCGLGWVLEEEAGQVVPLGYCDSSHRVFWGRGHNRLGGGSRISPLPHYPSQSPDSHLLRPLPARHGVHTVYKILFGPVCVSASAGSDKSWLSG